MNVSPAASRYAKALFALSVEHKQQAAVAAAVQALALAVKDDVVAATLHNPRLNATQRRQFAAAMAQAVKAPALLESTLGVLAANNRLSLVPSVMAQFMEKNDAQNGVTRVDVAVATVLTNAQRDTIRQMVKEYTKADDVQLNETLEANLKGGFRAFFNGQVWDASLSGHLTRLGTRLRAAIAERQSQ